MIKMTFQKSRRCLNILFITSISIFLFAFMYFATLPINSAKAVAGESIIEASVIRPAFVLTISVPEAVELELDPDPNGLMTVGSSVITVGTNSPNGYSLFLEMTGDDGNTNSLLNTANNNIKITSAGTFTDPVALENGKWGYAFSSSEDVLITPNGFDDNYDTMQSATPTRSKFAAVPENDDPAQKIAETDTWGDDILTVYYGVRAGYETAAGTYQNKVLFTALADNTPAEEMTFLPAAIFDHGGEGMLITTPLYSTSPDLGADAYILTPDEYESVTRTDNPVPVSTYASTRKMECFRSPLADAFQLDCTTVASPHGIGYNYIYVDIPRYNTVYASTIPIKDTNPTNIWELKTLQGLDDWPTFCADLVTPATTARTEVYSWAEYSAVADKTTVIPVHTMMDVRDGEMYTVKKLPDGNCWMTENLRLSGFNLTPWDSNVSSDWILPESPVSGTSSNTAYVYDTGNPTYGVYYSWYAATAGTGTSSLTSGNAPSSVCPAGWRLPTGGSSGEFKTLANIYSTAAALRDTTGGGPEFVLSGYRNGNTNGFQGSYGIYWSSTASGSDAAYRFSIGTDVVYTGYNSDKPIGYPVRCTVR